MSERCPTCDRADCPHLPYERMNCDDYDMAGEDVTYPALEDCRAHAVDWRARALAAETALHEVVEWGLQSPGRDPDEQACYNAVVNRADDVLLQRFPEERAAHSTRKTL